MVESGPSKDSGVTGTGRPWVRLDGKFYVVQADGTLSPWKPNWPEPRTSLEPTPAEKRRQEERERGRRDVPFKVARLRLLALKGWKPPVLCACGHGWRHHDIAAESTMAKCYPCQRGGAAGLCDIPSTDAISRSLV
jgi:hypothetical protein